MCLKQVCAVSGFHIISELRGLQGSFVDLGLGGPGSVGTVGRSAGQEPRGAGGSFPGMLVRPQGWPSPTVLQSPALAGPPRGAQPVGGSVPGVPSSVAIPAWGRC